MGDLVYVKKSGGPVMARFRVRWHKEGTLSEVLPFAKHNQAAICVSDEYLLRVSKDLKRYGVLMEVTELQPLTPFEVTKPGMSGWVTLPEKGLL